MEGVDLANFFVREKRRVEGLPGERKSSQRFKRKKAFVLGIGHHPEGVLPADAEASGRVIARLVRKRGVERRPARTFRKARAGEREHALQDPRRGGEHFRRGRADREHARRVGRAETRVRARVDEEKPVSFQWRRGLGRRFVVGKRGVGSEGHDRVEAFAEIPLGLCALFDKHLRGVPFGKRFACGEAFFEPRHPFDLGAGVFEKREFRAADFLVALHAHPKGHRRGRLAKREARSGEVAPERRGKAFGVGQKRSARNVGEASHPDPFAGELVDERRGKTRGIGKKQDVPRFRHPKPHVRRRVAGDVEGAKMREPRRLFGSDERAFPFLHRVAKAREAQA